MNTAMHSFGNSNNSNRRRRRKDYSSGKLTRGRRGGFRAMSGDQQKPGCPAVQSETAAEKKNEEQQSAKDNMMEPKNDAKPPPVPSLTVNSNEASVTEEDAQDDDDNDESDDDVQLALEYMETAWSILDQYSENPASYDNNNKDYTAWAKEQAPRFLTGLGMCSQHCSVTQMPRMPTAGCWVTGKSTWSNFPTTRRDHLIFCSASVVW